MPLYEYYCEDCHGVFELLRPPREASTNQPCPECDADAARVVSNFQAFVFRDGYPRKIPDDGTHWHLGTKVRDPVNKAVEPNEHPELIDQKRGPVTARPPDSSAMRVFAGEQSVARRRADRGGRVRVGEFSSFRSQAVDMRSAHFGRAVATQVAVAEVIGEYEDNVGELFFSHDSATET